MTLDDIYDGHPSGPDPVINKTLEIIRTHLGMDVAYVSEFVGDRTVFRNVDAPGLEHLIKPGDSMPLSAVYCPHTLEGKLPQLIPDTSVEPTAVALPITAAVPIGKHISVPIRLSDGTVYGMFCCLGKEADLSLNDRDVKMMAAFAEMAGFEIDRAYASRRRLDEESALVREAIARNRISTVFQPIFHLPTARPIGVEALSRFAGPPDRSPDIWFKAAAEAGLGTELELAAVRLALPALDSIPGDAYVAVNVSPETILDSRLAEGLEVHDPARIVLEVTEHASIPDYDQLKKALAPLRARGLRLAIDDAGAGYSSLQHILQLGPDLIKLDMTLTRDIDSDRARRALAVALIQFARQTSCRIIAEGIETEGELATLREIGVEKAQGYALQRPAPLDGIRPLFERAPAA